MEIENKEFWDNLKGVERLENDMVEDRRKVKRGIIIVEDGVIRKVELFLVSGDPVKSESEKVIKLKSLTDDLVKSLESAREKGIGI